MSMESVCEVFGIAAERNVVWEDVRDLADDEAYRLFYPDWHVRESVFEEPDWEYVREEMAKVSVNLRLLHDEYGEMPLHRQGGHGLHEVLRRLDDRQRPHEAHRAQGRPSTNTSLSVVELS